MRITKMLFTLGLVLLLMGCGPEDFLNPLYTTKDLVSDPLLPGVWEQEQDDGTLILEFQPTPGGCYILTVGAIPQDTGKPDKNEKPQYKKVKACLVQLGQTRFLDLQPERAEVSATTESFRLPLTPYAGDGSPVGPMIIHLDEGLFVTLAPVQGGEKKDTQTEYELQLTPAHEIFRIYVDQATLRLSYFEPPGDARTLSTEDLQKLVLQYADDSEVFSSLGDWQRKTGGPR